MATRLQACFQIHGPWPASKIYDIGSSIDVGLIPQVPAKFLANGGLFRNTIVTNSHMRTEENLDDAWAAVCDTIRAGQNILCHCEQSRHRGIHGPAIIAKWCGTPLDVTFLCLGVIIYIHLFSYNICERGSCYLANVAA